jgi:tripartite-type tricarboxylate transporter receptor subunit TctC
MGHVLGRGRFSCSLTGVFGALLAAVFVIGQAHAQDYPSRTIKVIVPFLAGSASDVTARLLSHGLAEKLHATIVVENRGGAGGNIGTDLVAKANPDGYTLLYSASGPLAINKTLFAKLPYDPETDFEPISLVAILPNLLVVNPTTIPVNNIKEFIAYLKARPGKINYASIGNGSSQHLAAVQFELATGTKMTHVPYAGAPPILAALLSGDVPVAFQNIPTVQGLIAKGQLKALAVTTKQRSKALPDVPTLQEEGLQGFESYAWFGLVAPKGTPAAIVAQLNKEVVNALAEPEFHNRFLKLGAEPSPTSPAEFKALIASEVVKWRKLIQDAAIPIVN